MLAPSSRYLGIEMRLNPILYKVGVVVLLFALTACNGLPSLTGGSSSAGNAILQVPQSPGDVVGAFLNAWGQRNYDAMYALLAPQSQGLTSAVIFREIYEAADAEIGTSGVTYTLNETEEQGISAVVYYNAQIASTIFGDIPDNGRMMRLVQTAQGWRVAWTSQDIFAGFAPTTRLDAIVERSPRGTIYDRNGIPLVEQDVVVTTLYINRGTISDESACLDVLSEVLVDQRGDIATVISNYSFETTFPIGDIDDDVYARYSGALTENCGAFTDTRIARRYDGHGTGVHVTGYIGQMQAEDVAAYAARGYESGELVGQSGIEFQFQDALAGEAQRVLSIVEPGGLTVRELARSEGTLPQDVTLTLDADLQFAAGRALADAYTYAEGNWGSREHSTGGGVVVLDIDTGAVLALASYPMFDPGVFDPDTPIFLDFNNTLVNLGNDARRPFINRVLQESRPPGSVFKIVTTAAAAQEGVWNPTELFYCGRTWPGQPYGDTRALRYDWRNQEPEERNFDTGDVTIADALSASCNPFFYQMGAELYNDRGPTTLMDYARDMGLGALTGIDLDAYPEVSGQLPNPTGADIAISEGIGQGDIQVTLLQMARMTAGIANGGTLYQPYVIQEVGRQGEAPTYQGQVVEQGNMNLEQATLDVVQLGMCQSTDSSILVRNPEQPETPLGTSWFVFTDPEWYPASYRVCGKTGTAESGRTEPFGWFVAYAPADDPQIAIAAMIEYGREGSETAAPIVRRIFDAYFNVPEDQIMPYPYWWYEDPYEPLSIPEGGTAA